MRRKVERGRIPNCVTRPRVLGAAAAAALGLTGTACGTEDFRNEPRPPQPIQLTAVITRTSVDVEPNNIGTGPIVVVVSNQDDESHTISLTGNGVRETVGPINPLDTASLQRSLSVDGVYLLSAGSPEARRRTIDPGRIFVGRGRQSNRDDVQVP